MISVALKRDCPTGMILIGATWRLTYPRVGTHTGSSGTIFAISPNGELLSGTRSRQSSWYALVDGYDIGGTQARLSDWDGIDWCDLMPHIPTSGNLYGIGWDYVRNITWRWIAQWDAVATVKLICFDRWFGWWLMISVALKRDCPTEVMMMMLLMIVKVPYRAM